MRPTVHPADDALFADDDVPVRDAVSRRCGVQSVTGLTYAPGGDPAGAYRSFVLKYDERGRRRVHERYDATGRRTRRSQYDDDGRLVAELAYDAAGDVDYRIDTAYGDRGWSEKATRSARGGLLHRIVAERDADGRLVRAAYRGAAGELLRTDTYSYDREGRLARVTSGPLGERAFEYGPHGELARKTVIAPGQSELGEAYEYEHDERGLLVRMHRPHGDTTVFARTFRAA